MEKCINSIFNHFQYKILAGFLATVYSDEIIMLLLIFLSMEILDIFTRWLALSCKLYHDLYPNSNGGLWIYTKFILQARRWRYIKSDGLRDGFCDKMIIYCLVLLLSALVDGALALAHSQKFFMTVSVTILALTESLSVLENLSECGIPMITKIRKKVLEKMGEKENEKI